MPSLIPEYEYDIFISYRQKDNKYDGWVTEFVNNLRKELEATFKEDVSIYFDENVHDGLLETHDVSDSLDRKLKCAILIPVISQTYCDPNSFAWKNELLAFNKMASEDSIGLKVVLRNGNVASRILPVRIHELDTNDSALLQDILGPIRSIDFVFNAPGVNRPLRAQDDQLKEAKHAVYYRDQVNKVANAIKQIIDGLRSPHGARPETRKATVEKKAWTGKSIYSLLILLALATAGYYIWQLYTRPPEKIAILVPPFQNLSDDKNQTYFSDGLTDDITDRLESIKDLRVITRGTVVEYQEMGTSVPHIAKELDIDFILKGSVRRQENKLRILVQLVKAAGMEQVWSETIEREAPDLFAMQTEMAEKIAQYLKVTLAPAPGHLSYTSTTSLEAYVLCEEATKLIASSLSKERRKAMKVLLKAISLDPQYARPYRRLARTYVIEFYTLLPARNETLLDSALFYGRKSVQLDPGEADTYLVIGDAFHAKKDFGNAYAYHLQAVRIRPSPGGYGSLANDMLSAHRLDSAIYYSDRIFLLPDLGPNNFKMGFANRGRYLMELGLYDSANHYLNKSHEIDPDHQSIRGPIINLYLITGKLDKALNYINNKVLPKEEDKRNGNDHIARIYAFKQEWSQLKNYLIDNHNEDNLHMGLALYKTGESKKLAEFIAQLKAQRTVEKNFHLLARIAVLENDLELAAKYYETSYDSTQVVAFNLLTDPFTLELANNARFRAFKERLDREHAVAIDNIRKMYQQTSWYSRLGNWYLVLGAWCLVLGGWYLVVRLRSS